MQIWIDGDACPKPIKDIVFRAAIRTKTLVIAVANQLLTVPASSFIKRIQVESGFDMADRYIIDNMRPNDLVVTADIPLADSVVTEGGLALNPRGELYSYKNIKQYLGIRNSNETLRGGGMLTGGPAKFSAKEIQRFANNLDKILSSKDLSI